jgi:nucleotide-binding universal stress UspA family protein
MTKVIAALDNSLAASPVLATALALGQVFDADVEAVHVPHDGARIARNVSAAAHVPLSTVKGPVAERLIALGQASDVEALVLGARSSRLGRRPLGSTAMAVATSLATPIVVVPPDARRPERMRRVLVPLEGDAEALHTPRTIIELARETQLDVVVLHVLEEHGIPPFTDQPQHEQRAREEEFLRRYCPWGIGNVRAEMRVGRSEEIVPERAEEIEADIVALGWSQELQAGRAPVVRAALEHCRCPVMLVPVNVLGERGAASELAGASQR